MKQWTELEHKSDFPAPIPKKRVISTLLEQECRLRELTANQKRWLSILLSNQRKNGQLTVRMWKVFEDILGRKLVIQKD